MLRTLFTLTLFSAFVFAHTNYTIRLAAYTDASKLTQALNAYPPALRKTIRTYKKGRFTYAHTIPTDDKRTLKTLLSSYKKVFKDAYIISTRLKKGQVQP